MTTEIYVNNTLLDLHKDENISMKYTSKDLQDISKVFSPFSQDFTFPYTAKNAKAFGFFGDTNVIKSNLENKFACKIYTAGMLSQTGFLILKDLKYKGGNPTDFTGSFGTTMTNLKDRIGDLTLNDLNDTSVVADLSDNGTFDLIQNPTNDYYVPLISNQRVWSYGSGTDNIKEDGTSWIEKSELRPALSMLKIIKLIIAKFNLSVTLPLENRHELKDAYVWCNKEKITSSIGAVTKRLRFANQFNNNAYKTVLNTSDSSITFQPLTLINRWYFVIEFINPDPIDGTDLSTKLTFYFKRKSDDFLILEQSFQLDEPIGTSSTPAFSFPYMIDYIGDFYIEMKTSSPFTWQYMNLKTRVGSVFPESLNNSNSNDFGGQFVNLVQALPPVKIIDFLQSFFKTFNISVFDTSPNDENLFWLTPDDIKSVGNVYSKSLVDYTRYVDAQSLTKSASSDYNYYNFKHANSKYRSNVDFKKEWFKDYGQTFYPDLPPKNAKEFKVETAFSIIPPVTITDTDIVTAYGFTDAEPTINQYGSNIYKPNYGELTIFYRNQNYTSLATKKLRFKTTNGTGLYTLGLLDRYYITSPFNSENKSLGFSILVFNSIEYHDTIFSRNYDDQIIRLINPNVLNHDFSLTLPASELYLNESLANVAPTGFRLQNDVIIGENRFSIIDCVIDITTGKTKMNLLNYI